MRAFIKHSYIRGISEVLSIYQKNRPYDTCVPDPVCFRGDRHKMKFLLIYLHISRFCCIFAPKQKIKGD